jgi:hypothetical protein
MSDRCFITCRDGCLLGLLFGFKAGPAFSGPQPCGFAILLAGEASEVMNLLVTAGVKDELLHSGIVTHGAGAAAIMSRAESRNAVSCGCRQWQALRLQQRAHEKGRPSADPANLLG